MITSIDLAQISGMTHMCCCISLYEILEKQGLNPRKFQVVKPDAFYYEFSDSKGDELIELLEGYEAEI